MSFQFQPPKIFLFVISFSENMKKKMGTQQAKTPNYQYKDCVDCFSDSYDLDISNMLYFVLFNKMPNRITEINDQYTRYRLAKKIMRTRKNYQEEKCNLGNYHLKCIGKNFKKRKRIAMMKEALVLLQEAHGVNHAGELEMKNHLKSSIYNHQFIDRYIYSFLRTCKKCRKEKVLRIPMRQTNFINIYQRIAKIEQNRLSLHPPEEENVQELGICGKECFHDCIEDEYEGELAQLLEYYNTEEIPEEYEDDPEKLSQFKARKRKLCVQICSKGTQHLYRYACLIEPKERYKKIPMVRERNLLFQKLHGTMHRPVIRMLSMLKETPYSVYECRQFIEQMVAQCQYCIYQSDANPMVRYRTRGNTRKKVLVEKTKKRRIKHENLSSDLEEQQEPEYENHQIGLQFYEPKHLPASIEKLEDKNLHFYLQGLRNEGGSINSNKENTCIFLRSEKMLHKFYKFGDCLKLEEVLKKNKLRKYTMYLLSAQNAKAEKTPVGLCLVQNEKFQTIFKLFELLFSLDSQIPESLVIDNSPNIVQALDSLLYYTKHKKIKKVQYFFPWKSVLKEIAETITKEQYQNFLLDAFQAARQSTSQEEYENNMKTIKALLFDQKPYQKFIQKEEKYSFSRMSLKFIGFEQPSYSFTQHLQNLREEEVTLEFMINEFIKLEQKEDAPEKEEKENIPEELVNVRSIISKEIYNKLFDLFHQSQKLIALKTGLCQEIIIQDLKEYKLKYHLDDSFWSCQCNMIKRVGLPCAHLMTVIKKYRGDIAYYMNERWRK